MKRPHLTMQLLWENHYDCVAIPARPVHPKDKNRVMKLWYDMMKVNTTAADAILDRNAEKLKEKFVYFGKNSIFATE